MKRTQQKWPNLIANLDDVLDMDMNHNMSEHHYVPQFCPAYCSFNIKLLNMFQDKLWLCDRVFISGETVYDDWEGSKAEDKVVKTKEEVALTPI